MRALAVRLMQGLVDQRMRVRVDLVMQDRAEMSIQALAAGHILDRAEQCMTVPVGPPTMGRVGQRTLALVVRVTMDPVDPAIPALAAVGTARAFAGKANVPVRN